MAAARIWDGEGVCVSGRGGSISICLSRFVGDGSGGVASESGVPAGGFFCLRRPCVSVLRMVRSEGGCADLEGICLGRVLGPLVVVSVERVRLGGQRGAGASGWCCGGRMRRGAVLARGDGVVALGLSGGRWSAIAARLPGRTDNEIKNVWHTHLKKKLTIKQNSTTPEAQGQESEPEPKPENTSCYAKSESFEYGPVSPPQCTTSSADDTSSFTTSENNTCSANMGMKVDYEMNLPQADESFWSEVLSADQNCSNETVSCDFDQAIGAAADPQVNATVEVPVDFGFSGSNMYDNCMDFWYNVFTTAGEISELLEI